MSKNNLPNHSASTLDLEKLNKTFNSLVETLENSSNIKFVALETINTLRKELNEIENILEFNSPLVDTSAIKAKAIQCMQEARNLNTSNDHLPKIN